MIKIREYKAEDRGAVERCIFELQEDDLARQPDYWQTPEKAVGDGYFDFLWQKILKNKGKIFVAEIEADIAGYVGVTVEESKDMGPCVKAKRIGYINDLVVLRQYKKLGIGKELIGTAEEYLKNQGCEYVSLDVTTGNVAMGFYKKSGYQEYTVNMKKKI